MGMTISEKILARASGRPEVRAGEIVWAKVDKAMMDDILGPRVEIAEKLEMLGAKIWDPARVTVISDHYTPPPTPSRRRSSSLPGSGPRPTAWSTTMSLPVPATR